MAGRGRNTCRDRKKYTTDTSGDEASVSIAGNSPILSVFLMASRYLINRQDRHERIVRLSRDVTIESKRIIFLLHSPVTKQQTKQKIIAEAKERFKKLINGPIKNIAFELNKVSVHTHYKTIKAGLQEFVEARTLLSVMEHKEIISLAEARKELTFTIKFKDTEKMITTPLTHLDYMLGLADLSGELMRKGINGISCGDIKECVFACEMIRNLNTGFLGIYGASPVLNHKMKAILASVSKLEHAVCFYNVRGREVIPKMILAPPPQPNIEDQEEDQGCY